MNPPQTGKLAVRVTESKPKRRTEPARGASTAIRLGVDIHPLQDLYYQLMRRSWAFLIAGLVASYLLANLAFACLYLADMNGISHAETGGFTDAFAFSVQTLSTIGYGGMSPQTTYAHMLVTAEAMVGLLGFAIATGLMFQKFARARAMVQFSDCVVISVRNGKPVLMLRLGNARGNEIIEANLRLTMLKPEVSEEGHRMRRLHDCDLIRSHTPIFILSWLVVHEIDENSPLWGETAESLIEQNALFIVTMTGIDATFSATVHARKIYSPDTVRIGERFVDVIATEAGRPTTIDYNRFDETEPDPVGVDAVALMRPAAMD